MENLDQLSALKYLLKYPCQKDVENNAVLTNIYKIFCYFQMNCEFGVRMAFHDVMSDFANI